MSIQGLLLAAAPNNILLGILDTLIGMIIGALPGLGANVAMTLALPLSKVQEAFDRLDKYVFNA